MKVASHNRSKKTYLITNNNNRVQKIENICKNLYNFEELSRLN